MVATETSRPVEGYGSRFNLPPTSRTAHGTIEPPELEYKYVEFWSAPADDKHESNDNLEHANSLLADGWTPLREVPMGGGTRSAFSSCLLVLYRRKPVK